MVLRNRYTISLKAADIMRFRKLKHFIGFMVQYNTKVNFYHISVSNSYFSV